MGIEKAKLSDQTQVLLWKTFKPGKKLPVASSGWHFGTSVSKTSRCCGGSH
jgi:hypothetical protein